MGVPEQPQPRDQVQLGHLLFAMNWEDPESDRKAMSAQPGETLMTICSGGCNTLSLLLDDPAKIYAVDISPSQGYLMELKMAAVRVLEYDELRAFLGITPSTTRSQVFERLGNELSPAARAYWSARPEAIAHGFIYSGRFESFARMVYRLVVFMQGRKRIKELFQCATVDEQRAFFDQRWDTVQWRWFVRLATNKRMLERRLGLAYFKFDDGSTSFHETFYRRLRHGIAEIPIATNYFLALYFRGQYLSEEALPAYLRKENLPVVKQRLERVEIVIRDARSWLAEQQPKSIAAFSLSNIGELMSVDELGRVFTQVARVGRDGARICFRNLIVPREVPEELRSRIVLQQQLSREMLATDRSFVYSRVQAYVVHPPH